MRSQPRMPQGMRFSLFVCLWIVILACRSSSLREGTCQNEEFERMGDPMTEAEEVEQIKEVVYAPPSRVHDGRSSCAISEPLPLRVPTPAPPHFQGHMPGREPLPLLFFMPAPVYVLALVPLQGPLPLHLFMPAPVHVLAYVPRPGPLPLHMPMAAPAHLLTHVPRREPLPLRLPMAAPERLLARVSRRATMRKFVVDVQAAGKDLVLLMLLEDWDVTGSYSDLIAGVEQLFEGRPDFLVTFNKFLPEAYQCIVPGSVTE